MEINKISQTEKSVEKMVPDDSLKSESYNSYCPDFSDIYNDSYEFWDFLHCKKEINENSSSGKEQQETKFWDFLDSSSNIPQSSVLQIAEESIDSGITTSNNLELSFKREPHLDSQLKSNLETEIFNGFNRQSPELKSTSSDDEFWDFLSCRSPVVTFKELIKNYNSINCDNESGIGSCVSRSDESPYASISDYYELEKGSTLNSSPSSVNTKVYHESENEMRHSSNRKDCDKLKETIEPIDNTNYIDVLKYLQQECVVSDKEVNLYSIPRGNTYPIKESENPQKNTMNKELDKFNQNQSNMQELIHSSSNQSELNVSSANQRPVYDGLASISSLNKCPDRNSSDMYTFKLNTQQAGKNQQLIYRRPTKRLKRNIQNRTVISNFNTIRSSNPSLTTSRLNSVNVVNFSHPNNQAAQQGIKHANSSHAEIGSSSNANQLLSHPITTHITTSTIPATNINTVPKSNSSTNTTPLYLLMSSNPETIQNPNYSHFFLVINNNNNNTQANKPTFVQNSRFITNANILKSTPNQLNQVLQSKGYSEVATKSDNTAKQNVLIVNPSNTAVSSSSASTSKFSASNIKYQTIPQVYLPYTSLVNSVDGGNQMKVQYLNKMPTVNNTIKIPVSVNNPISSSKISNTIQNVTLSSVPTTNFYSTVKISGASEQITNLKLDPKPKVVQSKCRQPLLKPIKNIPLGKDKYAIQQISTPVQICCTEELSDSQGYNPNLDKINESSFLKNSIFENKLTPNTNTNFSEGLVANESEFRDILSTIPNKNFPQQNNSCSKINLTTTNVATASLPSPFSSIAQNENPPSKNQIATTNSINVNVVPVSGPLEINKGVSTVSSVQMINTNDKQTTSCINLKAAGNLVPIKVGNTENKSLTTLQGLFPPPISMIPVCVLPQTQIQDTSQPSTSNVLILNGKDQIVSHKIKIDPMPNRERLIYKKQKEKAKKGRLKTVRELLQERRKSSNKSGKEIRVLRRVLRLSTCDVRPSRSAPTNANFPKFNSTVNSNSTVTNDNRKRPNILVLPSSSKTIMKNSFADDEQGDLTKEQESECFADSAVSENLEDSLSSCTRSASDKKDSRPRHYDMSQLNIGDFRVDDDIDSCGRFRSKFKVIFSKRLFYYDFPVSRCNQYSLKSTNTWEQMARIAVPFKSVVSMNLKERTITININTPPTIALGRLQARTTGIIPNSTMYDIAVESDCIWGCMIRSSFHHKIILRKKQASKLKSFLCYFDDRFLNIINIGLCENGVNSVDELSIFDGELSPKTLKQNVTKNKKHYIRRLSQWDSSENEDQKTVDEDDLVLLNQMCSCRVSCRSIRCSCVKAAKSCNTVCNCTSCDNPLNILETLGMNLDFSLSDSCLFQNIYQIPKLIPFLTKEVKLTCCNTFARVQDCIPGTVLCPNVDCNVPLEFSWCKKVVCYPERNPRNHCSFCGQCCFSNGRHCMTCNRCYVVTSKYPYCPTCQEKTSIATLKDMESNDYKYDIKCHSDQKNVNKSVQKPEIVILDVYSLPKTSTDAENEDEAVCHKSPNDPSTDVRDCISPTDSVIIVD